MGTGQVQIKSLHTTSNNLNAKFFHKATTDGFTEGDRWVYSFAFVHDVAELVERRGGNESFVKSLNEFYDGGWVDFTNEVSTWLFRF